MSSPSADQESLFQSWLEEHGGIFMKVSRSFAHSETEAGELQQEMLFQLWISLPRYAGQAKASTWIYRVCLNTALTWRRGAQRRERRIEPGADVSRLSADASTPAEAAGNKDLLEQLYSALQAMPESERALVLLMLDGQSYREMAEVTGLTENHVGVALTRARKRLAILLKGVTDELE
jgi:RNA polymerase sigma-70 factor (ECF subfamily)